MSSHKTATYSVLSFILQHKQSDEGENLCLWEISMNVNKFLLLVCFVYVVLAVWLLYIYFVYPLFYTDVVDACLFLYPLFFILIFIRWSCKEDHCFVCGAFVYHFKNTISIFVTIFFFRHLTLCNHLEKLREWIKLQRKTYQICRQEFTWRYVYVPQLMNKINAYNMNNGV